MLTVFLSRSSLLAVVAVFETVDVGAGVVVKPAMIDAIEPVEAGICAAGAAEQIEPDLRLLVIFDDHGAESQVRVRRKRTVKYVLTGMVSSGFV
ncbi:MAG: hypothetical protein R3C99_00280 [Pirellulaceae bacterium]